MSHSSENTLSESALNSEMDKVRDHSTDNSLASGCLTEPSDQAVKQSHVFSHDEGILDEGEAASIETSTSASRSDCETDKLASRVEIEAYEEIAHSEVTSLDDWEKVQKSCLSEIPPIDPEILVDLEVRARDVAGNLDHMLGVLSNSLKAMSQVSTHCLSTYADCVDNVSETVDANIKSMYTVIARCEELNASLRPVHIMANQVKDIKKTLDIFEAVCK